MPERRIGAADMTKQMRILTAPLAVMLLAGPVARADGPNGVQQLEAEILSSPSATQALTARCARLQLANPPSIRAVRDHGVDQPAGPDIRRLLKVSDGEPVRYRRVRLSCGAQVLSDADNWYVPARLTADMNAALDGTDTPFGTVVKPLHFQRRTLKTEALHDKSHVLRVTALLVDPQSRPFSLVQENYSRALVAHGYP
jgi:chorismate-pyruvate lyase